eukprot:scaffold3950_cov100-Skeletonema_dohrnii-CCMP3373.AAC.10
MSSDLEAAAMMCCASCGVAEVDDVKLMKCDACDLVRYCGYKCQQEHRMQHEASCKERATELRDEVLFRQPESSHLGDCPICFLPIADEFFLQSCCSKIICDGCSYANAMRETKERQACPFCRHPVPISKEEIDKNHNKRLAANDPIALLQMGTSRHEEGDYESSFDYWTKAAELGDATSHFKLAGCLYRGEGVEKDEKKELYHLEEAAIAGHPDARCTLACHEMQKGRFDRAVKHWIIAANLGCGDSIQRLKVCYKHGVVSKEDFAASLRAHQAAVNATKSPQREAVPKFYNSKNEAEVVDFCCASCGIAEVDDVKLKNCADCDLVRYCCDSCQRDHKPKQHEVSCRERAAELRDEVLFRQPESSHLGDCPICLLPLPIDKEQPVYYTCCSKVICQGYSCAISSQTEEQVECPCPFCREDIRKSDKKKQNILKRVAANDPVALQEMGAEHYQEGNYVDAFEYWTKASEMGDAESHLRLSLLYWRGRGVEKDEKKGNISFGGGCNRRSSRC